LMPRCTLGVFCDIHVMLIPRKPTLIVGSHAAALAV
jgi:hypothetical protein